MDKHDTEGANKNQRSAEKEKELRRERRLQAALERLNNREPACVICGISNPIVLEKHHLEGQHYGDTLVDVCRNDHRILTANQKDHPAKITEIPDPLEIIAHFLLGLADLLELIIKKIREFVPVLIDRADPRRDDDEPQS